MNKETEIQDATKRLSGINLGTVTTAIIQILHSIYHLPGSIKGIYM